MQFEMKQVLVGAFTLSCTAAAGGWALGTYLRTERVALLERTVASYEKSGEWHLPATLESIKKASDGLARQLATLRSVEALEMDAAQLRKAVSAREKEFADVKTEATTLRAALGEKEAFIKSLNPRDESFRVATRKSATLAGANVVVGVNNVHSDSVEVTVNNQNHTLKSGQYVPLVVGRLKCRLIVTEILYFGSPEGATFRLACTGLP